MSATTKPNPVFCAIDTIDLPHALALATQIRGHIGGLKLGLEFFLANSVAGYQAMQELGLPIFLDLKLHDIPNTVAGAIRALAALQPDFLTIHASGGAAMMQAATDAIKSSGMKTRLLAVTVLTSLDGDDLSAVGQGSDTARQVARLAALAKASGLDGVICSPDEIDTLRAALGPDFILMVPGIRPDWAAAGDQKRVKSPREAMASGATYLVIGRPVTTAPQPAEAAARIAAELAG